MMDNFLNWSHRAARFIFKPQTLVGAVIAYAAAFGLEAWKQQLVNRADVEKIARAEESDAIKIANTYILTYKDNNPQTSVGFSKTILQLESLVELQQSLAAKKHIMKAIAQVARLKSAAAIEEKVIAAKEEARLDVERAAVQGRIAEEKLAEVSAVLSQIKVNEASGLGKELEKQLALQAESTRIFAVIKELNFLQNQALSKERSATERKAAAAALLSAEQKIWSETIARKTGVR